MYYHNELYHHGIKGQKWGIRRYQNEDGSLTAEGKERYGQKIQELERKAIKSAYKERRKNGGSFVFKSYRISTGKNFDAANAGFDKKVSSDSKYRDLSKKAFDAEKKRLLYEKKYINDDDAYDRMYKSKEYQKLEAASRKATAEKDRRVKELASQYVDTIKEAKLNDLNITENRDIAKKYISAKFNDFYWDENLEYNVDNYYEPWVDTRKFN